MATLLASLVRAEKVKKRVQRRRELVLLRLSLVWKWEVGKKKKSVIPLPTIQEAFFHISPPVELNYSRLQLQLRVSTHSASQPQIRSRRIFIPSAAVLNYKDPSNSPGKRAFPRPQRTSEFSPVQCSPYLREYTFFLVGVHMNKVQLLLLQQFIKEGFRVTVAPNSRLKGRFNDEWEGSDNQLQLLLIGFQKLFHRA